MKSFLQYIRESNLSDADSINPSEHNNDEILEKIIKIAWKSHESEVKKLFKRLSEIDPEIKREFNKLKLDFISKPVSNSKDIEMIRPPVADTGGDLNNSNL